MPKYVKKGTYTLGQNFVAGGGVYAEVDVSNLRLWTRFRSSPVDQSGNSATVSYAGSPTFSSQKIPNSQKSRSLELPVATFDGTSDNAVVAATSVLNFSGDVPFSVACWVNKPDDGNNGVIFEMPNVAGSASGWGSSVTGAGFISMALQGTGGGKAVASSGASAFPMGKWVHLAITYDGSKAGSGISVYINGKKIATEDDSSGTFTTLDANGSQDLKIFANYNASSRMAGSIAEFGAWGSELTPSAVKALYRSTEGRYYAKSGVVSLPSRVILRERDNQPGRYPNQLRNTGNKNSNGNTPSVFNDAIVQTFKTFSNAVYPLVSDESEIEKLNTSRLIPTPNQNSSIKSTGKSGPILTTEGTFIRSSAEEITHTPFDESRIFLKDTRTAFYASGTSKDDYPGYSSPLRDKIILKIPVNNRAEKIITRYSGFHMPNDPQGLFSNTFRSTGFYYYNFLNSGWEDIGLTLSSSMFYSGSNTATKLSCVSLGTQIKDTSGFFGLSSDPNKLPKLQQFKMSDHMGVMIDSISDTRTSKSHPLADLTSSIGYHLIGAPTQAGLAPWHSRYHATGSQTIKMSDYITGEMAIEKVILDIPVIVQRQRGTVSGDGSSGNRFFDSCRDIDNYMFFLYRQRKPTSSDPGDTRYVMSSSRRELICSGAASFYNSNAFSGRVPDLIRRNGLPHTPSFSHDFRADSTYNGSPGSQPVINSFTGSIRIEMKVATANGQPVGASRFPLAGNSFQEGSNTFRRPIQAANYFRSVATQDWWIGGRTHPSGNLSTNSGQSQNSCAPLIFKDHETYTAGLKPYAASQNLVLRNSTFDRLGKSMINRSPRSFNSPHQNSYFANFKYNTIQKKNGFTTKSEAHNSVGMLGYTSNTAQGLGQAGVNYPLVFGSGPSSRVSGFIMEPEDELILGLDAGISMLPSSGSGMAKLIVGGANAGKDLGFYSGTAGSVSFGCMSGSFMKILTGHASVTIFGSQMRKDREVLYTSNQGLTSHAIHESIGDARVVDQIDTPQRHELSGSYVDRLVFGKIVDSNRPQTNTVSKIGFNRINTGAVFRNTRGVVSLFSKDRTGISVVDYTDSNTSSPNHDVVVGYPPSFSTTDGTGQNFFIENRFSLGGLQNDPYFITPSKSQCLLGSNIVSLQRFITLPSEDRTYYDSMGPNILEWSERVGADMGTVPAVRLSRDGTPVPVIKIWTGNLEKISVYPYEGNPSRSKTQRLKAQIVPSSGSDASLVASAPYFTEISMGDHVSSLSADRLILTTLFNRGFRYANRDLKQRQNNRGYFFNATGSHGPRYGMISPVPARPVFSFRRDKFGQFRDMLEQSKDTKFFITTVGEEKAAFVGESPIQVKFVDRSDGSTPVDPFTTSCFNCSTECTSSRPYSDIQSSYTPPPDSGNIVTLNGTLFAASQAGVSTNNVAGFQGQNFPGTMK